MAMPRFHSPLIEPDRPFSGIRLSDKKLTLSPTGGSSEVCSSRPAPARRADADQGIVWCPDLCACAYPEATDGADAACAGQWLGTKH